MPELTRRQRLLVLGICCMSLLLVGLDSTIVNVALPSIQHDLHASVSGLQWTVDAYVLTLATLLMLSGSLGDRLGRRRVFCVGLVLFTGGSLLCGLAPGLPWLVAFRVLQAVGGSMLNPVAMSIITNTFTDPRERAQAIGLWAAVSGLSMALGPVVGGALIGATTWRAVFWINIPVGLTALLLMIRHVPESRAERARRADPVGQGLVLVMLASLTYGIIEGPNAGYGRLPIAACFATAALALTLFIAYEPTRAEPLIDLRLFRSAPFSGAVVTAVCAFAAYGGFMFVNVLYLQDFRGMSALRAGLCTLPMAVVSIAAAPLSGRLVGRRGPRVPLLVAGTGMTAGALTMIGVDAHTSLVRLFAGYALFGLGFGMVNTPITNAAVSGMPRERAGVAAAVASTSRQTGISLGVATVGAVVTSGVHGQMHTRFSAAAVPGWWIVTGCSLVVLLLGILTTGRWARRTAESVAADLVTDTTRVRATTS